MNSKQNVKTTSSKQKVPKTKKPYGYLTEAGYWGYVPQYQSYILFATEGEYLEYLDD